MGRRRQQSRRDEEDDRNYSSYAPPLDTIETIDHLVKRVDEEGTDKYRAMISEHEDALSLGNAGQSFQSSPSKSGDRSVSTLEIEKETRAIQKERHKIEADLYQMLEDQDYHRTKQKFAYVSIVISSLQLLVVMVQLALCGVAPLEVNPFVGPYPDSVSEWGGKNAYLIKHSNQWWRIVTPCFLHVGVLHLMVNVAVQLEAGALFEREWGSMRFLWLYLISEVGCILVSCAANPDTIAVGSSGAIMGLFGAKLAQVYTQVLFDTSQPDAVRLEQVSAILCTLSIVMALSFFTYIDWSGHMGGLATGFFTGLVAFSRPIIGTISRSVCQIIGVVTLLSGLCFTAYYFEEVVEPDEDLADACEYFRNLFEEGYDCTCVLFG